MSYTGRHTLNGISHPVFFYTLLSYIKDKLNMQLKLDIKSINEIDICKLFVMLNYFYIKSNNVTSFFLPLFNLSILFCCRVIANMKKKQSMFDCES